MIELGRKVNELIGKTFGRLTVTSEAGRTKSAKVQWLCRCDCGIDVVAVGSSLISGNTRSCGCYQREQASECTATHGMSRTRFYTIWTGIIHRCSNEKSAYYAEYGGRGITVCERWKTFESFRDDMYDAYNAHVAEHGEKDTTIERNDVNGNYEPQNCRWATNAEQAMNKRVRRDSSSGVTGVIRTPAGKYIAYLRDTYLGTFADISLATAAREAAMSNASN